MTDTLVVRISGPVATITLARPDLHNALDTQLIGNITQAFQKIGVADAVRLAVIEAQGPSFCAGIDMDWIRRSQDMDPQDKQRDAMQAAMMLDAIDRCPKPVVAVIQGAALGAGAGLAAVADVAIASDQASFALAEVRVGLAPSVAAPYLAAAMGPRAARRYMLTGERFDAREALRLGLIHAAVVPDKLAAARDHVVDALLKGGPKAQAAVKDLVRVIEDSPMGPDLMRYTASHFSELRSSDEGREGLDAIRDKRLPAWVIGN